MSDVSINPQTSIPTTSATTVKPEQTTPSSVKSQEAEAQKPTPAPQDTYKKEDTHFGMALDEIKLVEPEKKEESKGNWWTDFLRDQFGIDQKDWVAPNRNKASLDELTKGLDNKEMFAFLKEVYSRANSYDRRWVALEAIGWTGLPESFEFLKEVLKNNPKGPNSWERVQSIDGIALTRLPQAFDFLVENIFNKTFPDDEEMPLIVRSLGKTRDPRAFDLIMRVYNSAPPDSPRAQAAVDALGESNDPRAFDELERLYIQFRKTGRKFKDQQGNERDEIEPVILRAMAKRVHPQNQERALKFFYARFGETSEIDRRKLTLECLGRVGGEGSFAFMKDRWPRFGNGPLRGTLISAIGETEAKDTFPYLRSVLNRAEDDNEALHIAKAIGETEHPDAFDFIRKELFMDPFNESNPDDYMVLGTIEAMGETGSPEAWELLKKGYVKYESVEKGIRLAALKSILKLLSHD